MIYYFRQNNSGGSFADLEYLGDGLDVFHLAVEAESAEAACDIAENSKYNIYFNGVDNDIDCPCCGDRWSRWASDYESVDLLKIHEELPCAFIDKDGNYSILTEDK